MCPKYARTFPELFPNTPKTARNPSEVHPKSTRNLPDQRHSPKSTRNISEMYPKHIRIVTELCPAYSRTMPGSLTASHSLRPSDMGPPCLGEQRAQRAIEYRFSHIRLALQIRTVTETLLLLLRHTVSIPSGSFRGCVSPSVSPSGARRRLI